MALFKLGKTKIPHRKNTAAMPAFRMAPPSVVEIPTSQHIGAPATPTVKAGDKVFVGTLIAEAGGFVSAPVHSSVSGTVKKIGNFLMSNGRNCASIIIESDGEMTPDPSLAPPTVTDYESLSAAARAAGLVGLGGAGFPTSVKLDPKKVGEIDTLIINGAECEPYITSDTRTMLDDADYVVRGVTKVLDLSAIPRAIIGIEANKPECIAKMREVFASDKRVSVVSLPSLYPQGGEKILIYNTTRRAVPEGKLPSDVGVLIMNVTTVAALAKYLETGMPLVEKCLTVDGSAIASPKNVIVPIGTPVGEVIEACGGFSEEAGKIFYGGPMMGTCIYSLDAPVLKNNNAITALSKKDSKNPRTTACIHCGRCVAACPMGLNPTIFARAMGMANSADRAEKLSEAKVNLCIECGCCSFVCPAKRPLVENNRLAKADLREFTAKQAKKD
jgi:electron transport complex protein RnfC